MRRRIVWRARWAGRSGGARCDGERAIAHVYALGRDRLALRLRQAREAELADAPVARQLVQELAGERHAVAAGAALVGAAVRARGLQAEDGGEVSWHGPGLRVSAAFPSTGLVHPSTWAANCEVWRCNLRVLAAFLGGLVIIRTMSGQAPLDSFSTGT